jgi:hypothetical protein
VAAFVFSLVGAEDAEARHRRHRRHRCGCHGYTNHCAPAPSCCGVVHTACPGGVCGVTNGSHSAGYGTTNGQPTLPPAPGATDQAAPPPPTTNGAAPAPGTASSPSDRPAPPATNGAAAPPPPPQQ